MKRFLTLLALALTLSGCAQQDSIDPREHLVDEEELDDSTQSKNEQLAVSDNILPTTVFYDSDQYKPHTYDYVYMMYSVSSDVPPIGVHRKVTVSHNLYTVLEEDEAILTAEGDLELISMGTKLPQEIEVRNRQVINNTLGYTKAYSELSLSEALTYINNLDAGVSDNGINGTLFIPDCEYSERPYSIEITRKDDGSPDIIRVIGFGTGVTNDDTQFTDFATYEFE